MAEGFLQNGGSSIDIDNLTAIPEDVAQGNTFVGLDNEDIQVGTLTDRGVLNQQLGINQSFTVPAGIYGNGSAVYQSIPTQGAITIDPNPSGSYAGIYNKYMTGDVTVLGVENLIPENIKMGAVVGTISGTWQGYVNTSPLTPYWYGIFYAGQSGALISAHGSSYGTVDWYFTIPESSDHPFISLRSRGVTAGIYPAIRFSMPVELEGVRSVTVGYSLNDQSSNQYTRITLGENLVDSLNSSSTWVMNPDMGYYETFVLPSTNSTNLGIYREITFNITSATRLHYVYFNIGVASSGSVGVSMGIHYVKFNK